MARLYCWSCASPVSAEAQGIAPLCTSCAASGPQIRASHLRWLVRTQDGSSRGPLSREAVQDQLVRRVLSGSDRVAREGGAWRTVAEHHDFRTFYLPGTPEWSLLNKQQVEERKAKATVDRRRRGKTIGALVGAGAVLTFGAFGAQTGLFVVPQDTEEAIRAWFSDAASNIGGSIESAVDEEAAVRAVQAQQVLPGDDLITELTTKWPAVEGSASMHLTQGRIALWQSTRGSAAIARDHFEKALVLSPRDPEAAGGLAEALALLYDEHPDVSEAMAMVAQRADIAGAGSPAAVRARAVVARASGNEALALDLAMRCGDPPDLAGAEGEAVDLGCALVVAELGANTAALEALEARMPEVYAVRRARMFVALRTGDVAGALEQGGRLSAEYPQEVAAWAVLAQANVSVGRWGPALKASAKAAEITPGRLDLRVIGAEIMLKQAGRAGDAHAAYGGILGHPGFKRLENRAQVVADAAAAALEAGAKQEAVALADQALSLDKGNAPASLTKARALVAIGEPERAEGALRDVDANQLTGHEGARWHVGAARLYIGLDRERMGVSELASAREADPFWDVAALASASVRLKVGNLDGALEEIEAVAMMDHAQAAARSPLVKVWYPRARWATLRRDLEKKLVGDVRFASRGTGIIGIVAWTDGMTDAGRQLKKAVEGNSEATAAHAALAQYTAERGQLNRALEHASTVLAATQDKALIRALKGRILHMQGHTSPAEAELNKALQDGSQNPGVHRQLALAMEATGDVAGARRAWESVASLAPNDIAARAALLALAQDDR
jgi:tetratricopeptide (TPR) repeat protein